MQYDNQQRTNLAASLLPEQIKELNASVAECLPSMQILDRLGRILRAGDNP